jgi:hypothetical protein
MKSLLLMVKTGKDPQALTADRGFARFKLANTCHFQLSLCKKIPVVRLRSLSGMTENDAARANHDPWITSVLPAPGCHKCPAT